MWPLVQYETLVLPHALDNIGDDSISKPDMASDNWRRQPSVFNQFVRCSSAFDSLCHWLHPPPKDPGTVDATPLDDQLPFQYAIISEQADRFKLLGHDFQITTARRDPLFAQRDVEVVFLLERLEHDLDIKNNWRGGFKKQELAEYPINDSWQFLATDGSLDHDHPFNPRAVQKSIDKLYDILNQIQAEPQPRDLPETIAEGIDIKNNYALKSEITDEVMHGGGEVDVAQTLIEFEHGERIENFGYVRDFDTSSFGGSDSRNLQGSDATISGESNSRIRPILAETSELDPAFDETRSYCHREYQSYALDNNIYFAPVDEVISSTSNLTNLLPAKESNRMSLTD